MTKDHKLSAIQKCAIATIAGCVLMIAGIITAVCYTPPSKPRGASSYPALPQQEIFLSSLPSENASPGGMPPAGSSAAGAGEGRREQSRPALSAVSGLVSSSSHKETAGLPAPEKPAGGPAHTAAYEEAKAVYQQKETAALNAYHDYMAAQGEADAAAARADELYRACAARQAEAEGTFAAYSGAVNAYNQTLAEASADPARQEAARVEMERLKNEYEALNAPYTAALNEYNAYLSSSAYTGALAAAEEKKAVYQAANAEMEAAKQAWQALK